MTCKQAAKSCILLVATVILCTKLASCVDDPAFARRLISSKVPHVRTTSGGANYQRRAGTSNLALPQRSRSGKTVLTRPAMRLHRYRPPSASARRRIFSRPPMPGFRRVIFRGGATQRSRTTTTTEAHTSLPIKTITETTTVYTAPVNLTVRETPTPVTAAKSTTSSEAPTTVRPTSAPSATKRQSRTKMTLMAAPTTTRSISTLSTTIRQSKAKMTSAAVRPTSAPSTAKKQRPTASTRRKSAKHKNMQNFFSPRRFNKDSHIEYNELMKKLDYFMAYYPSIREAASKLGNILAKQEQSSREERRRIWKGVFRVRSDLRTVTAKCELMHRNITHVIARAGRRAKDFQNYQKANQKKIDQIETHQGSQDDQYYEIYKRSDNNTRKIQRLTGDMAVLLPLVSSLVENIERSSMQEKRALEMLDSHARGNIADMTNQILVQQNTLANLGNQVRTEMDLLHAEKRSIIKGMEQHNKHLTETVSSHLSSHVKQMNQLDGMLNRQAESIKYITEVVGRHDDLLGTNELTTMAFLEQVTNVSNGLKRMEANISHLAKDYRRTESRLNYGNEAVERLEESAQNMVASLTDQHQVIAQTMARVNATEKNLHDMSSDLKAYKVERGAENENLRQELDEIWKTQRGHSDNISSLLEWKNAARIRSGVPHYPSDEPAPQSTSVTPQELKFLLAEIGVEDRMSRLTRVLRHQQQRMSNVTRAVLRVVQDNEVMGAKATQYFNLVNTQSKVIKDQNETIGKLEMIASKQDDTITRLNTDLTRQQETVMKLTHILANIATQLKSPMGSQRDCHDVWLNGNRKSGVYNVIEDMNLRPVQCSLTEYGGWTVIQRRKDGSKDFDRTMREYRDGFGDIYGEHWLGLDSISTLTQKVRPDTALQIIMQDWEGRTTAATYSHFYLYGKSYRLAISGYRGDAGDSLSPSNGMPFSAKSESNDFARGACVNTRNAGWWFASRQQECGESNLNGVYHRGPTQDASILTTIHWKRWHGTGYPLKSVTMQIIPAEVLAAMLQSKTTAEGGADINGHSNEEGADPVYENNRLDGNPYGQEPYGVSQGKTSFPTYEEDLRESGITGIQEDQKDYENFDYNILLNDG